MSITEPWAGAKKMYCALEMLRREVYRELPIQQINTFLLVAQNEGITMKILAQELALHQANVSRNVKELGDYAKPGKDGERIPKGHGLLFVTPNEYNRREYSVYLTPKGRRIAEDLNKMIAG